MSRIAGVNLKDSKPIFIALTGVYGVGIPSAIDICKSLGIDSARRAATLSDSEWTAVREYIDSELVVEGELRRVVAQNIKRKKDIGTYQGTRHRKSLPARGQRTHTNARTRKGKARAIAGKKK